MKKITALLLTLFTLTSLLFALGSCAPTDTTEIRVGYMSGPTGMGMAKMIDDYKENDASQFKFEKFKDTTSANAALKQGLLDIACLPTNEAAKFYNSGNSDMQVLALNCLNSLFIVTNDNVTINSIDDLNNKTIYTCKNGTPRIILEKILQAYNVNAVISYVVGEGENALTINTPQEIPPIIKSNKADIVLAPEPIVSTALSLPGVTHKVALDLSEIWDAKFDTPIAMGCIVVSKKFAKEHPVAIENFLKDYKASIEYMSDANNLDLAADLVVKAGISGEKEVAKSALANLGDAIAYIDGSDMKNTLVEIYKIFGMQVIGEKLPDDEFYYGK